MKIGVNKIYGLVSGYDVAERMAVKDAKGNRKQKPNRLYNKTFRRKSKRELLNEFDVTIGIIALNAFGEYTREDMIASDFNEFLWFDEIVY